MFTHAKDLLKKLGDVKGIAPVLMAAPLFLSTPYLWLIDGQSAWWAITDFAALLALLFIGLTGIVLLPGERFMRWLIAVIYVPLVVGVLMIWSIWYRGGL